ncbi:MAG: hypothetical protein QM747_04490 [Nocardioides sp.]
MSETPADERPDDDGPMSVPDQDLPDDVRPEEENPLAEPAGDDVPEDVVGDVEARSSESSTGDSDGHSKQEDGDD